MTIVEAKNAIGILAESLSRRVLRVAFKKEKESPSVVGICMMRCVRIVYSREWRVESRGSRK